MASGKTLKLATYNVNGIATRLPHLLEWLREAPGFMICSVSVVRLACSGREPHMLRHRPKHAFPDPGEKRNICRRSSMFTTSSFAEIAALAGDPARAAMLDALMDGRALTATELAAVAGVTPQTASGHLARLAQARLLLPERQGRHRYYRIADAAVARLLRKGVAFDGVVAASDLIALGAIRALRRVGLSVPGDVSVVGYDDMLLSRLSTPALSTIRQDNQRAGQLLVASILDSSGENLPSLLPTELIIRESCGG